MTPVDETPTASLLDIPIVRTEQPAAAGEPEPSAPNQSQGPVTPPPQPANDTGADVAEPAPTSAEPVPAPDNPAERLRELPRDLYAYWRRLARDGMAEADALDAGAIAERWPYALLLRGRLDAPLDIVRVFRPTGANSSETAAAHPLAGDLCSQVSSWALALARDCVVTGEPAVDVERFMLSGMARNYRGLALPCRRSGERATYVLLYLHAMGGRNDP